MRFVLLFIAVSFSILTRAQKDTAFSSKNVLLPTSNLTYKMILLPAGSFQMGSPEKEAGRKKDEGPAKKVSVSSFWIGAYEVTHDQFDLFYKDVTVSQDQMSDAVTRPSAQYVDLSWGMGKSGGYPVNSLQQRTALMFCRWLYQKTGEFYRLPTEAEWEYACRAGTTTTYFFGNDAAQLKNYAWYKENCKQGYNKVGRLKPNPWGLYDMLGNVAEWVLDQYDENSFTNLTKTKDPVREPTSKQPRLLKGGSYLDEANAVRCAVRLSSKPDWNKRDPQVPKSPWWLTDAPFAGFRVVKPAVAPSKEEIDAFFKKYISN